MVFIAFMPSHGHIAAKNIDANCGPLSVRRFIGIPKLLTQKSCKVVPTAVTAFFVVGLALRNF